MNGDKPNYIPSYINVTFHRFASHTVSHIHTQLSDKPLTGFKPNGGFRVSRTSQP